jgi:hypothetical protein
MKQFVDSITAFEPLPLKSEMEWAFEHTASFMSRGSDEVLVELLEEGRDAFIGKMQIIRGLSEKQGMTGKLDRVISI